MSKMIQEVYIVSAVRTSVGKAPRGVFKNTRPDDLLAHVISESMSKVPSVPREDVEDVIIGCAMPEGAQGMNVARIGLLLAGLPDNVPGVTVNRFCSSGLQTIAMAAERIALGQADVMIAGGVESMSMVPLGGHSMSANLKYCTIDENIGIAFGMGITAEKVAERWKITREAQDEFALESHRRALRAQAKGEFNDEIVPYLVEESHPNLATDKIMLASKNVAQDEGPRADTSLDALAKLRPVFALHGTVTAGNSSQTSDGAAALVLVSEAALKRYNLQPIAKFSGFSVAGVPPEIMGIGPAKAIPKALERSGFKIDQMEWIELNEAFAAQSLAVINELHLDRTRVNPLGGAIALGHPLGATGAIRAATIIHGMRRHKQRYGMVTMCIGTGMGAAGIFEAI